jgi:hypothetical protein
MFLLTAITKPESFGLPDRRCFGFFGTFEKAQTAVDNNTGNMRECLYEYLVIEEINEGIHPHVIKEWWNKWSENKNKWEPCDKPEEFFGTVNWSLG